MKKRYPSAALLLTACCGGFALWTGPFRPANQAAVVPQVPAPAATDGSGEEQTFPMPDKNGAGSTTTAQNPVPGAASGSRPVLPALKPVPGKAAAQAFDPRFVQPATRMKLFGPEGAERAQIVREMEARERAEKAKSRAKRARSFMAGRVEFSGESRSAVA